MTKQKKYLVRLGVMFDKYSDNDICYRIKYKDKYIKMPSGKSSWTSIGAAKNAMICHYGDEIRMIYCKEHNITDIQRYKIKSKDLIADLFKYNIIQIVEV